jgi:hypothetical protein
MIEVHDDVVAVLPGAFPDDVLKNPDVVMMEMKIDLNLFPEVIPEGMIKNFLIRFEGIQEK